MRAIRGLRPIFLGQGHPFFRQSRRLLSLLLSATALFAAPASAKPESQSVRFDISAQDLARALDLFARQSGVQILYPYSLAMGRRGRTVHGAMPPREALARLLRHSGMEVAQFSGDVVILRAGPSSPPPLRAAARPAPPARSVAPPTPTRATGDIIVTGRAIETPLSAPELSYAITRIDAATLMRGGPTATADLFKQIPGFWVESTGGEASNNIRSRGIPTDGYSSVALLEDGLPVQYDGGLGYLNTDQIFRTDPTIEKVEAVRGGPSAIFAPNAPGGSIDFITRNPLRAPGYTLLLTTGTSGYRRVEGFAGIRVTPDLAVSLGGFYRTDDGMRDPGYPADRGGQIRGGVVYDDGHARLSFNVKHLDDRVILYLPVPLQLDAQGHVQGISGFNPLFDTLAGPDNVHVAFKSPSGPQDFDLSEGTHSRITFYTLSGRLALGPHSALEVKGRLRTGVTIRNGLFPIGKPQSASDYIASVWPQLAAAFPGAAAARIAYADTGAAFLPDSNGNGLVVGGNLLSVRLPMTEFIGDARLTNRFALFGQHDVALGLTYADSRLRYDRNMATILLDVRGQAKRLDVMAVDAAGREVGALTDNGVIRYGSLFDAATLQSSNVALYLADEWKLGPRWRVDIGARWERTRITGGVEGSTPVNLGDPTTLADDAVLAGNGTIKPINRRFSGLSWTAAVNFRPAPSAGLFLRFTRIARLPSATEFYATPDRTDEAIVPITMAEAGLILQHRRWNLSAVAFRTHFARLPFTDYRFDPATSGYVSQTSIADTSAVGLEFAGHADLFGPLRLDVQATFQDPRYRNFLYNDLSYGAPVMHDVTGNQLIRVPKIAIRVTPNVDLLSGKLHIALGFAHYSKRFADVANTQRLPPYSLIDLQVQAHLTRHMTLAINGSNLTNALGLTEGNPRMGSFDSGVAGARYFLARPEFGRTVRATFSIAY